MYISVYICIYTCVYIFAYIYTHMFHIHIYVAIKEKTIYLSVLVYEDWKESGWEKLGEERDGEIDIILFQVKYILKY